MASGLSGRGNFGGSKGFDFGSDDILCSYEDYGNHESSNGSHAETAIGTTTSSSSKDFHKCRVTRSMFPPNAYSQPDDSYLDVTATVEKTMKKHGDNLMRFLEGISSRLSQLELYCYNLDKSIGEMRSDLDRDNGDADSKLKSIEKPSPRGEYPENIVYHFYSQSTEEKASPSVSDSKKTDHASEMQNQQLDLALPHQVAPPQQPVVPHSQAQPQNLTQQSYYLPSNQLSNPHTQAPAPAQVHVPAPAPGPAPPSLTPTQTHQAPPVQSFPRYPQQWPQQLPQQVQQQQQSTMQPQMMPPSTPAYTSYPPTQSSNPSPPNTLPHNNPMQVPYSGVPQPVPSRSDTIPYGYGVPGRTPPQQMKSTFEAQPRDGYQASGSNPPPPPGTAYMINTGHPQYVRNHPYNELVEKLVGMGFRVDHVGSVIQRMEESGQPVDFNAVLDRLSVHSSGGSQRGGW
ncbi:ethylene-responsive family protein [Hibiscus syriacus]|uniref:Ethylene-responsive family protein n=1 Tax=Hibiscus syriacus TaxID=106335 RepID=A0A6A2ZX77_HIBSY|nr:ethylene-responsive family protein [Hibiscus syriacus]